MTDPPEDSLLLIGQVVRTQGIKGAIRILPFGRGATSFTPGCVIYLQKKQGTRRPLTVASFRKHGQMTILSLREVEKIAEAQELVGCFVFVAKENLPALPPDEFYWYQLLGLKVQTEKGTFLGTLAEIMPTGSNDVFVVRKDHQECLIPATDEVIAQVDLKKKTMVIRPLEGLLPEDDL